MGELAELNGPGYEFKVGGSTWKLSPLRLADLADLEQWLELMPMMQARRALELLGDVPEETRRELLAKAWKECTPGSVSLSRPETLGVMNTTRGMVYVVYLSLRKRHPDITQEQVADLGLDRVHELSELVTRISHIESSEEGDGSGDPTPRLGGLRSTGS